MVRLICQMDIGRTLWPPTTVTKIMPFLALLHELICHITVMVIPSDCSILGNIENGKVDLSDGHWENIVATYYCDKDYGLVGTATRVDLSYNSYGYSFRLFYLG